MRKKEFCAECGKELSELVDHATDLQREYINILVDIENATISFEDAYLWLSHQMSTNVIKGKNVTGKEYHIWWAIYDSFSYAITCPAFCYVEFIHDDVERIKNMS